ncbi:chromatin assembly factor 1 subunit A-like [Schistocerca americana]|uniref:chromatin assembly factor 1 subunit A-like n=1 Tax=Schistocerca americana TaxID=7009 RepID=UPI001F4F68D4|nr:chromatin assembly factor 1 subunit A-like [Schistocerca americana]
MKDNQEIVINDDDDGCTPPRKKLKQARLPFQVLSPVVKPATDQSTKKKRKLSEEGDIKVAKIVKCDKSDVPLEAKENVRGSVKSEKNENNCKIAKSLKENEHSTIKEDEKNCLGKKYDGHENSVDHLTTKNVKNAADNTEPAQTENSVTQDCDAKTSDKKVVIDICEEDNDDTSASKPVDSVKLKDSTKALTSTTVSAQQSDCREQKVDKAEPDTFIHDGTEEKTDKELGSSEKPENRESTEKLENEESLEKHENGESPDKSEKEESSEKSEIGNLSVQNEDVTPLKQQKDDSDSGSIKGSTEKKTRERKSGKSLLTPKNDKAATSPEVTPKAQKLTPKQLQKQMESAKKKEEKERQRLERERKKAEEKEEKHRQKIEKEEQKRKEKEEKEEQRKKEKEEKEKKRLAELEAKLEEKKLKEEEKRKKEEQRLLEKKKKDEKKQAEEDAKRKESAAFTSYFLSRKSDSKPVEEIKDRPSETFMPFEVKSDMRLAPLCRVKFESEQRKSLDTFLCEQNTSCNYLKDLRNKMRVPGTSTSTWPVSEKSDVVIVDDPEDEIIGGADNQVVELHPEINLPRPKLLQFWDNRRPPYWGTWRKKSSVISQRKPFNKDEKLFDYEVDSDDEWEEEEPGESLHGSDDEKESEDEYEVDNDFFVPHGYLSDEENLHGDDEDTETLSPESQKAKLKLLEHEFEEEMKQKTERLKPRIIGCIWTHKSNDAVGSQLLKLLSSRRAVYRDGPIITSKPEDSPKTGASNGESDPVARRPKKRRFPESAVPALIKLIHGNTNGIIFLVKEFIAYYKKVGSETNSSEQKTSEKKETETALPISKNSTSKKIRELASWTTCTDEGPLFGRNCWYVPPETRAAHGLPDLMAGNKQWEYNLKPRRREPVEVSPVTSPVAVVAEPKVSMSITKFTKKLSREECQKQLKQDEQPQPEARPSFGIKTFLIKPSESQPVQKKRVPILVSAARGQKLPQARHIIPKKTVSNEIDTCNISDKCKVESKTVSEQTQSQVNGKNADVNCTASLSGVEEEKVSTKAEKSTEHCKEIVCIDLDD